MGEKRIDSNSREMFSDKALISKYFELQKEAKSLIIARDQNLALAAEEGQTEDAQKRYEKIAEENQVKLEEEVFPELGRLRTIVETRGLQKKAPTMEEIEEDMRKNPWTGFNFYPGYPLSAKKIRKKLPRNLTE